MEYDNTNRGMLTKNQNKQSDNHPDYSGTINVDGREFWLSGWLKTSKAGSKYFSLAVKPKEAKKEAKRPQPKQPEFMDDDLSDTPF